MTTHEPRSEPNPEAQAADAQEPRPGKYQHYKGNLYQVIGLAHHSETQEPLVVYRALYGKYGLWVRPAKMFTETVEVNGERVPRFRFVGNAGT